MGSYFREKMEQFRDKKKLSTLCYSVLLYLFVYGIYNLAVAKGLFPDVLKNVCDIGQAPEGSILKSLDFSALGLLPVCVLIEFFREKLNVISLVTMVGVGVLLVLNLHVQLIVLSVLCMPILFEITKRKIKILYFIIPLYISLLLFYLLCVKLGNFDEYGLLISFVILTAIVFQIFYSKRNCNYIKSKSKKFVIKCRKKIVLARGARKYIDINNISISEIAGINLLIGIARSLGFLLGSTVIVALLANVAYVFLKASEEYTKIEENVKPLKKYLEEERKQSPLISAIMETIDNFRDNMNDKNDKPIEQ